MTLCIDWTAMRGWASTRRLGTTTARSQSESKWPLFTNGLQRSRRNASGGVNFCHADAVLGGSGLSVDATKRLASWCETVSPTSKADYVTVAWSRSDRERFRPCLYFIRFTPIRVHSLHSRIKLIRSCHSENGAFTYTPRCEYNMDPYSPRTWWKNNTTITSCGVADTICSRPSPPSVGAEAPRAAEPSAPADAT